eukprot:TRINITY_DN95551_c0_g1_i1.p1 TRINITY_DN95551_c0_g1~~TRINITY_DN95551_c0_g1_i1.p1  ORF type:complete len:273 (-),score=54.99 TRINITY_DN95551_c0_g1_i1:27-845(-)
MAPSSPLPCRTFESMYVDRTKHNALGAVLRWCDTFGALYMDDLDIDEVQRKELLKVAAFQYVNRVTQLEILVSGQRWEEAVLQSPKIRLSSCVSKVGRTSFGVTSFGSTEAGEELFRFSTVIVNVDADDSSKTRPMLYPEAHKAALREVRPVEVPKADARPAEAFVWRTSVRHTDCDLINHMNNAVYGDLMEDARRAALAAGSFSGTPAAKGDVRLASVEYLGQPKAGQTLDVAVWWDAQAQHLGFEFKLDGAEVVAKGVLVPQRDELQSKL